MWFNGMIHRENLLSCGEIDEQPHDIEYFDFYLDGSSPFGESNNNVVVQDINLGNNELLASFVLERLNPLRESS